MPRIFAVYLFGLTFAVGVALWFNDHVIEPAFYAAHQSMESSYAPHPTQR